MGDRGRRWVDHGAFGRPRGGDRIPRGRQAASFAKATRELTRDRSSANSVCRSEADIF
jgi:hypothetical protein